MSNKVAPLGVNTIATQGTTTAYTVPTGKCAKVKLMYRGVSGVNSTLRVLVNGVEIFRTGALTTGHVHYSNSAAMYATQTADTAVTGLADATTVSPGPKEYYLDEGDTVQYIIGTADFSSMNFQVVGAEIDIA